MSIKIMGMIFERQMTPTDKLIALCLADHAHDDGTHVFPSVASLAHKASMGTTATRAAIRRLENSGVLVQITKGGGRGHPAEYHFDLAVLRNPTDSDAFINPTPGAPKPNGSHPETQRLDDETQRVGVAESLEPSVNLEPSGTLAPSARKRDLIYETLFALETGMNYSPEARTSLTPSAEGALNKAVAEVRSTGISPDELVAAIGAWPTLFDRATCTPNAIAKHLPQLRSTANGRIPRQRQEGTVEQMKREILEMEERRG